MPYRLQAVTFQMPQYDEPNRYKINLHEPIQAYGQLIFTKLNNRSILASMDNEAEHSIVYWWTHEDQAKEQSRDE